MISDTLPPSRKRLIVGEVFASADDLELSTVVGSCVTVCLHDPVNKCGGMNHFLLPTASGTACSPSANYGDLAMERLLAAMYEAGAERQHLQAKVFGAANALRITQANTTVGERNRDFIFEYLRARKVPVVAMRVGGFQGLTVHFFCKTGQAYVRPVDTQAEYETSGYEGALT